MFPHGLLDLLPDYRHDMLLEVDIVSLRESSVDIVEAERPHPSPHHLRTLKGISPETDAQGVDSVVV